MEIASPPPGSTSHSREQMQAALPSKLSPKTAQERGQPPPCPSPSCSPVLLSPLKSAQRRLLPAICCQRLEKPNINTAANACPSFLSLPPHPSWPQSWVLFPSPAALHPHPPLFGEPAAPWAPAGRSGAGNGSLTRGGGPVASSAAGARNPPAGTCRSGCSAL